MNETLIDTNNNSDNNPLSLASLCYTERNGKRIPVFPYVIAFTGHREFAMPGNDKGLPGYTEEEIKNRFKNELEELAKLWKKKSGGFAPLILLTGLAEGADQIVAQAALELKDLNVKVIAVLPMNSDIFRETIKSDTGKEKFTELLQKIETRIELPLEDRVLGHEDELKKTHDLSTEWYRQIQYRRQAEFISLHSHLHFVFWDGVIADAKGGGTSETVMFKLQGNVNQKSATNLLTFSSIGPVVQFLLPRNDAANLNDPLSDDLNWSSIPIFYWTREILRKLGASKPDRSIMVEANRLHASVAQYKDVQDVISRIGELNIQGAVIFKNSSQKSEATKQKSWDALFGIGSSPEERTPEAAQKIRDNVTKFIDSGTNVFIDHYIIADTLAPKFQSRTRTTVICYAIAFGLFILFSGLLNLLGVISHSDAAVYNVFSIPMVYLYEAALAASAGIFVFFRCRRYHYKYHYYRAIAEALRIQIFWRIALLPGCISGFYRSHQIFKTEWVRASINSLDVLIPSPPKESLDSSCKRIDFVKEMWIKEQQEFFTNRILQKRKTSWIDRISNPKAIFILTLIALGTAPFWNQMQRSTLGWTGSSPFWHYAFIVVRVIIAIAVALYVCFTIITQKPIHEAEANRYERELFPFDRAMLLLSQNSSGNQQDDIKQKQEILRQLGEEALAGNSDWLLSVVKRELSFRNVKLGSK